MFDPRAVAGLVRRCTAGAATGVRENQALVAIVSAQLWHRQFINDTARVRPGPLPVPDVVLADGVAA